MGLGIAYYLGEKTMASRRVEVRGKEKRELMKRMKGRTWAISIETKDISIARKNISRKEKTFPLRETIV